MSTIKRIKYTDYAEKLLELNLEHSNEIARLQFGKDGYFNPSLDFYTAIEKNRSHLALIVEDNDEIVGYLSVLVYRHQHHKHLMCAATDSFFIPKKHRGVKSFKWMRDLFKFAENILKEEYNVNCFFMFANKERPLRLLANTLGFEPADVTYMKRLDK